MSLREQKKAETRTALGRAAAGLILNEGQAAATVSAVAKSARVSTRTFHNYFGSVEDALVHFVNEQFQRYLDVAVQRIKQGDTVMEALEYVVLECPEGREDPISSYQSAVAICSQLPEAEAILGTLCNNLVVRTLRDAIPEFSPTEEESAMVAIVSTTIANVTLGWRNGKEQLESPDTTLEDAYRLLFRALKRGASDMPSLNTKLGG
ncbi:MAG: TetR family transcriptional regulator [Corynebacterium sp.]|nr:TetR family transcriptional regulator [Corynebacterium sp.]